MELTLESAFSPGGMIGNASYILLIASMAMRNMFWLRLLAIFSGLAGIAYDAIWLTDPVGTFWESLFTLINLVQWIWLVVEKRGLKLTPSESLLKEKLFPNISDSEAKKLFSNSTAIDIEPNHRITRQGKPVSALHLIITGKVDVEVDGKIVSHCHTGDYIGEISYLSGEDASATTHANGDVQLLSFDKDSLAALIKTSDTLGHRINAAISDNLIKKLAVQSRKQV